LKVLLITPPFTQLNTPYPATAYLKGFFNTLGVASYQADLSLEVALSILSKEGLQSVFQSLLDTEAELSDGAFRVFSQRKKYLATIDPVVRFLQNKNPTLALTITAGGYLPQGPRFDQVSEMDAAFGSMGTYDKARHLATLYLEDLGDLITEAVDPHFGFSRYAERLGRTTSQFDEMYSAVTAPPSWIPGLMLQKVQSLMQAHHPQLVCLTAPFPGNVFASMLIGYYIKTHFPAAKVCFGGGYANTELRRVYDARVFECIDFITLDDGEAPVQHLLEYLAGQRDITALKRTFCLYGGVVSYMNGSESKDVPQREVGTPDYSDLKLDEYISVIEQINPMHRLWSDGRWNKMTLAHGCYWGKCAFCDISLDYIGRYEPVSAALLCDRIEEIIGQTGQNGFHFVDEAAPPALMRDLALEIIRRELTVVWWTNIRFEKSFTYDLCRLLRESGCIAVSGGLEVASDRLLEKMQKGVTVAQVARVTEAFTKSGVMVHAYLMYGFPTQTDQETVDSLERVRQMFDAGILQSAFWHQFAMTAHSPVGLHPAEYGVVHIGPEFGGFAENDYYHEDPHGAHHEQYAEGLKLSLYYYMQGMELDCPLQQWFDFPIPRTKVPPAFIRECLQEERYQEARNHDKVCWIGGEPVEIIQLGKKRSRKEKLEATYVELVFSRTTGQHSVLMSEDRAAWFVDFLQKLELQSQREATLSWMISDYEAIVGEPFDEITSSLSWEALRNAGLLFV